MKIKQYTLVMSLVLFSRLAEASFDFYCSPAWSLLQPGYSRCNNLPFLSPGNDRRVNLMLLLADAGHVRLHAPPVSREDGRQEYGKVPFSLEYFEQMTAPSATETDSRATDRQPDFRDTSRCVSNNPGREAFRAAVQTDTALPNTERQLLLDARRRLQPDCAPATEGDAAPPLLPEEGISSPAGRLFRQYLLATEAFYGGRYDDALSGFLLLGESRHPWLRETARYLTGRTLLNMAQQFAFDEYGFPDLNKVEPKELAAAGSDFTAYLQEYPAGRYAASARGLLRRVYWLGRDPRKLADEYLWQLNNSRSPQHNLTTEELVREVDSKLLDLERADEAIPPLLLAPLDLALMRPPGKAAVTALEQQQKAFADNRPLYDYLLAARYFYVDHDPGKALKLLSAELPATMTYLDFSRLMVRGLALEATGDAKAARRHWLSLAPQAVGALQSEAVQLALARNYERSGETDLVFAGRSPVTDRPLRAVLIRNTASPELLRRIAGVKGGDGREQRLALYTLLYKNLLTGHYREYLAGAALLPPDAAAYTARRSEEAGEPQLGLFFWKGKKGGDAYACDSVTEIVRLLATNPDNPLGRICLGDFMKANNIASLRVQTTADQQKAARPEAELGTAPTQFPGSAFHRGEAYKIVMNDPKASRDLRAYALFRAVKCYQPVGNNACGGTDEPLAVRKSWYKTLKRDYPESSWAKSLKYFW